MNEYRYLDLAKYDWLLGRPQNPVGEALIFYTGRDNVHGILHLTFEEDAYYFSYGIIRPRDLETAIRQTIREEKDIVDLGEVEHGIKCTKWLQDAAMNYINLTASVQSPSTQRQSRKTG